jgi:prevent-host-death family protein
MIEVGVHEAKTHLSRLLQRVAEGEEVLIKRGNEPVARLVDARVRPAKRPLGTERGVFEVPENFDDPLPDDLLDMFEK